MHLTVLSWNVHKALGSDGKRDPRRILKVISVLKPDVAILQEVDRKIGKQRALFDHATITELTGMAAVGADSQRGNPLGWHGNLILLSPGISIVATKPILLPHLEPRGAVIWTLERNGVKFDVVGMHLGLTEAHRKRQISAIADEISGRGTTPTIVAGDTNDWRKRGGVMKPMEEVLSAVCEKLKTFPARIPMLSLDRIMAGRGARLISMSVVPNIDASDHLPIISSVEIA